MTATTFSAMIVGDEILSGKRADKHLPKLIELLAAHGLSLQEAYYVGDDRARITAALARAFAQPDTVMFSFGGIGATPDDHTRQCAAAALGVELALHPEAEQLIYARMRDVAAEQGVPFEPDRDDNRHRLNMGVFPVGARIIANPYNKIPGFCCHAPAGGTVHFVPGFPVMAWPMVEAELAAHYATLAKRGSWQERSVIVYGAMEASLTPLMEELEAAFVGVKVFSLPSVDHPEHGRHIELGVKGKPQELDAAYHWLKQALAAQSLALGPEMVRDL